MKCRGGIYLFRTRKPYAMIGLPVIGRHNGYTGQTRDYRLRWAQHIIGGGKYRAVPKSWSDLDPKPWRILPLPRWLFLHAPRVVDLLEAVCIFATAPVYNVQLNKGNLRRISLQRAAMQRRFRDNAPTSWRIGAMFIWSTGRLLLISGVAVLLWQVISWLS
jgi:hypothetical protein